MECAWCLPAAVGPVLQSGNAPTVACQHRKLKGQTNENATSRPGDISVVHQKHNYP